MILELLASRAVSGIFWSKARRASAVDIAAQASVALFSTIQDSVTTRVDGSNICSAIVSTVFIP